MSSHSDGLESDDQTIPYPDNLVTFPKFPSESLSSEDDDVHQHHDHAHQQQHAHAHHHQHYADAHQQQQRQQEESRQHRSCHLIVCCHGLMGNSEDFRYLSERILESFDISPPTRVNTLRRKRSPSTGNGPQPMSHERQKRLSNAVYPAGLDGSNITEKVSDKITQTAHNFAERTHRAANNILGGIFGMVSSALDVTNSVAEVGTHAVEHIRNHSISKSVGLSNFIPQISSSLQRPAEDPGPHNLNTYDYFKFSDRTTEEKKQSMESGTGTGASSNNSPPRPPTDSPIFPYHSPSFSEPENQTSCALHGSHLGVVVLRTGSSAEWTLGSTLDGVDFGGKRVVDEIRSFLKDTPCIGKISFVGHSLGGLYARYAAGKLFQLMKDGEVPRLRFMNYVSLATPHLGSWQHSYHWGRTLTTMSTIVLRRTGRQLFVMDGHGHGHSDERRAPNSKAKSAKPLTIGEAAEKEAMERSSVEEGATPLGSPDFVRSVSTPPFSYSSPLLRSRSRRNSSSSARSASALSKRPFGHERKISDFSLDKSGRVPAINTSRPPVSFKLSDTELRQPSPRAAVGGAGAVSMMALESAISSKRHIRSHSQGLSSSPLAPVHDESKSELQKLAGEQSTAFEGRHSTPPAGRHSPPPEGRHIARIPSQERHSTLSQGRHSTLSQGRHTTPSQARLGVPSEPKHMRQSSAPSCPEISREFSEIPPVRPRTESQPSISRLLTSSSSSSQRLGRPKSAPGLRGVEEKKLDEPPLLAQMCEGPYMEALHAFERCSLYSNIRLDIQVSFTTSSIVPRNFYRAYGFDNLPTIESYPLIVDRERVLDELRQRGQLDETLPDKFTGNTRLSKNLNKMLHALNTVPWRRWDCVSRPGMWSLLNHNELIVKHPRHLNYGAPVMDHLVETLLI